MEIKKKKKEKKKKKKKKEKSPLNSHLRMTFWSTAF